MQRLELMLFTTLCGVMQTACSMQLAHASFCLQCVRSVFYMQRHLLHADVITIRTKLQSMV